MFEAVNTMMQTSGNYKTYRKEIASAKYPCLPYFAVFLRDLTFIEVTEITENIMKIHK